MIKIGDKILIDSELWDALEATGAPLSVGAAARLREMHREMIAIDTAMHARIAALESQLREREEECAGFQDMAHVATRRAEFAEQALAAAREAEAAAMALVLNHEGHIERLRNTAHVADTALSLGLVANARESLRLITCNKLAADGAVAGSEDPR